MHELSVALSLLANVERVAREHHARSVSRILLKVGPLSGVEPHLLERAWPLAVSGTVAETAELVIEAADVVVACDQCAAESVVPPNRLVCASCGNYRTRVIGGQDMTLQSLELEIPDVPGDPDDHPERGRLHGAL